MRIAHPERVRRLFIPRLRRESDAGTSLPRTATSRGLQRSFLVLSTVALVARVGGPAGTPHPVPTTVPRAEPETCAPDGLLRQCRFLRITYSGNGSHPEHNVLSGVPGFDQAGPCTCPTLPVVQTSAAMYTTSSHLVRRRSQGEQGYATARVSRRPTVGRRRTTEDEPSANLACGRDHDFPRRA